MSRRKFGWDLPPGVRVSDIPGNRPEDETWERIVLDFYENKLAQEEFEKIESVVEIVDKAIEYGIEVGNKQADMSNQENRFYESHFIEEALEKDGVKQETIDKIVKILKGDYETP